MPKGTRRLSPFSAYSKRPVLLLSFLKSRGVFLGLSEEEILPHNTTLFPHQQIPNPSQSYSLGTEFPQMEASLAPELSFTVQGIPTLDWGIHPVIH